MAARLRTLPAAIAPVLVGTAAASYELDRSVHILCLDCGPSIHWGAFVAAMAGSILIQIGTNLANDYSDAKRGADTAERLGPVRVTSAGLIAPRRVLHATWIAFAAALAVGVYLATVAGPEILAVGAVSIAAGVLYTGGPRPYGYAGLGELFVFVFFGLVAVNGAYYVQLDRIDLLPLLLSIPVGLLSTAILVVNNVRDLDTDARAGKRTLAVRLGRERTRILYAALIAISFVWLPLALLIADGPRWGLLALASAPLALGPLAAVRKRTDGPALNGALAATGLLLFAFSALLALGLIL